MGEAQLPILVCIVTYNSRHCIEECLNSLLAQQPPARRVVVVDNASSDGTADQVASLFPSVEVIRNTRNVGFGGASDQGIRAAWEADCPYVFLLNPDARLPAGALHAFYQALEQHPEVAAANPIIDNVKERRPDGSPQDPAPEAEVKLVNWLDGASGSALFLRSEALKQVGSFYAPFFMYGEDTDLLWRLRARGWRLAQVPGITITHLGSVSSKPRLLGGAKVLFFQIRNHFIWVKRNRAREGLRVCLGTICWAVKCKITVRRLLHPTRLAALLLGVLVGGVMFITTRSLPAAGPASE